MSTGGDASTETDTTAGGTGRSWWIVLPAAVALIAGVANAWELLHLLVGGSFPRWTGTGVVALVALVGTVVALIRVPGPSTSAVVVAAAGLLVGGGVLLLDVGFVVFTTWLVHGLRDSTG